MLDKGLDQVDRKHYELLGEISQHRTEHSLINSATEHSPDTPARGRNSESMTAEDGQITDSSEGRNSDSVDIRGLQAYLSKQAPLSSLNTTDGDPITDSDISHRIKTLMAKVNRTVPELSSQIPFEPISDHCRDSTSTNINRADHSLDYRDSLLAVYWLPELVLSTSSEHHLTEVIRQ
jgi:hypothetical protein